MGYQKILQGDRLKITNKETFPLKNIVTSNLLKHEIMVTILKALDCPIRKNCIELENGPKDKVTSVCQFLGPYPAAEGTDHLSEKINCDYSGKIVEKDVRRLHGEECCGFYPRCAHCDPPEEVVLPNGDSPEKSHAFIYFRPLKE